MKEIGLSLWLYHDSRNHFPPSYSVDRDGHPLHSWRVCLLPYFGSPECTELFNKLKLEEPWNSPHNKEVFENAETPHFFQCSLNKGSSDTNFLMVIGPNTISNGAGFVSKQDVSDGLGNTIAIVEVANSGIKWFEPRDLSVDDATFVINGINGLEPGSLHKRQRLLSEIGGANFLFLDGNVYFLFDGLSPRTIREFTTIAGGEKVDAGIFAR